MRRGWYKRARKKFVRKRVYSWRFQEGWMQHHDKLECRRDGVRYQYSNNTWEQRIRKLKEMGFVKGFWSARQLVKRGIGEFYWHKILEDKS